MGTLIGMERPEPDPLADSIELASRVTAVLQDRMDRSSGTRRIEYKALLEAVVAVQGVLELHADQRTFMESNSEADQFAYDLSWPLYKIFSALEEIRTSIANEQVSLGTTLSALEHASTILTVMRERFGVSGGVEDVDRKLTIARADIYRLEAADSSSDLAAIADDSRLEAQSAAGDTAGRVLGWEFAARAARERVVGNQLRGLALLIIFGAIVLSFSYARSAPEVSWSTLALKVSIGIPIAAMIVFLVQESRSHLREASQLQLASLQLGTIAAYCARIPSREATEVLVSFGLSLYTVRPVGGDDGEAAISDQLGAVLDTAERISRLVPTPLRT